MTHSVDIKLLDTFPAEEVDPARLLQPAEPGDVGIDLRAAEDVSVSPGQRALVPTGLTMALPAGLEAQVRPRSGQALKEGLTVLNTPGTVDPGYRGEVGVIVHNSQPTITAEEFKGPYQAVTASRLMRVMRQGLQKRTVHIKRGNRIAQLVFAQFVRPELNRTDELPDTARGEGGFGSTGS